MSPCSTADRPLTAGSDPMSIAIAVTARAAGVAALAGAGIVATIVGLGIPIAPTGPGAWIDAPAAGLVIAPGHRTVLAHASAMPGAPDADLLVDGHKVATAVGTKSSDGTLALFDFDWTAPAGKHEISIRTSTGIDSSVRTVFVTTGLIQAPTAAPTPTSSPSVSASPSAPPVTAAPSPPPRPAPPPPPAPTPPQVGVPTAAAHVSWCGGVTTVSATATNATSVTIAVSPGGPTRTAANASGTWTIQVHSGDLPAGDFDTRDSYTLTATATGPGGTVQSSGGTLTMDDCKP